MVEGKQKTKETNLYVSLWEVRFCGRRQAPSQSTLHTSAPLKFCVQFSLIFYYLTRGKEITFWKNKKEITFWYIAGA